MYFDVNLKFLTKLINSAFVGVCTTFVGVCTTFVGVCTTFVGVCTTFSSDLYSQLL